MFLSSRLKFEVAEWQLIVLSKTKLLISKQLIFNKMIHNFVLNYDLSRVRWLICQSGVLSAYAVQEPTCFTLGLNIYCMVFKVSVIWTLTSYTFSARYLSLILLHFIAACKQVIGRWSSEGLHNSVRLMDCQG